MKMNENCIFLNRYIKKYCGRIFSGLIRDVTIVCDGKVYHSH